METTINALDALRALLDATPANPVPVDRTTLAVAVDELAAQRSDRNWIGDLDDLQQFVDVVEDGAVTPDDVAVARDAIRALHDTLAGRAG